MGYDTVRLMERLPDENPDVLGLPDGLFVRPTVIAVFDSVEDTGDGGDARSGRRTRRGRCRLQPGACERLGDVVADFERSAALPPGFDGEPRRSAGAGVERVAGGLQGHGARGRRNTSGRRHLPGGAEPALRDTVLALPPFSLYRALRRTNPSPFLFFLDFGDFAIVGSSPEILVRLRDDTVTIRPIAGTRRAAATRHEEDALAEDMLADEEGMAEHLMLLDLGRNDVGRVAEVGRSRSPSEHRRVLQPRHAHRLQRGRRIRTRIRRAGGAGRRLSGRHGLGRAEGPRDGDHRRAGARSSAGIYAGMRSAISAPTARWTPASPCAPPSSRTAACISRPAPASSPTATRTASTRNA